jgi:hypothetical protein
VAAAPQVCPDGGAAGPHTPVGRAAYWAESAEEVNGVIDFRTLNYPPYLGQVLDSTDETFSVEYFGTIVTSTWQTSTDGGTILTMRCAVDDEAARAEMTAGWCRGSWR